MTDGSEYRWFEIHAVDHCNMRCDACSHFSPHFTARHGRKEYRADDYICWLDEMVRRGIAFDQISVLGGEPFLHSDLAGFIRPLKERYGKVIFVVSNGFWLWQPLERWSDVFAYVDSMTISEYPSMMERNVRERAGLLMKMYPRLKLWVNPKSAFVDARFTEQPETPNKACPIGGCFTLTAEGKVFRCSVMAFAGNSPKVTREFLHEREVDAYSLRGSESYDEWRNRQQVGACRYCTAWKDVKVPWTNGRWKE